MAIPFLQPEDDDAARLQHAATQSGPPGTLGPVSPGPGSSGGPLLHPPPSPLVSGSIPIPGSPAPIGVPPPPPSGTSTAVQTPLLGPAGLMHGDQLVQLFYEALYRYSRGDTPSTPISQSPQSSSCSPFTTGYYNTPPGGQVFFPQTPSGVLPPRTPNAAGGRGGARIFFGQPTPSPSGSSSYSSSQHSANSPDASYTTTPASCSSAAPIFHQFPSSFSGVTADGGSTTSPAVPGQPTSWPDDGSESSESDSSQPSSSSEAAAPNGSSPTGCSSHCLGLGQLHQHRLHHHHQPLDVGGGPSGGGPSGFIPPHLDFMAGREQLQEFAGKIPQRKKKAKAGGKSKKAGFLEQTLVWPTLAVTATLIALGCGLLAAR
uniref:(northern house mosquito) hypothetical protein n=3 Tax=Culex pipiens TaxID=7175 RepID=A0A8D8GWA1_CULPI